MKFKLNLLFLVVLFLFSLTGLFFKATLSFIVVLMHELAHAIVAKRLAVEVREIELLPFGGVAKFRDLIELNPHTEFKVAIAGPLLNFFLAAVACLLIRYQVLSQDLIWFFLRLNIMMGLFNFVPAFPLDGGRILRAKLSTKVGFKDATAQVLRISKMIAVLLTIVAIIGLYYGYINIMLVIISFFIYFVALKEGRFSHYALMQYLAKKRGKILNQGVVDAKPLVAFSNTSLKDILDKLVPQSFHTIMVIDEDCNILGFITEDELIDNLIKGNLNYKVKDLLC
ncbi:site-2 protease family protein [Halanaerobacter jeridensis]|uniref:Stage IV sporulation protein FB n=1 Tax=Halanaerobacter jeridensis TaxID=706427 RepID=A0A938XSS9_9FIRM|nr:M50 family metallopeptidase [Halanaerobacter jeridensis]MBM7556189.1 stage IV sporulation protein FB [Halanaerobacter jeridensis]